MKRWALVLMILLVGCASGPRVTASLPPTGRVRLAWDANTESDLAGYKIYWGTTARTGLDPLACGLCGYASSVDVKNVTQWTIPALTLGQTYWFSATAYDTSNNESGFSNEVNGLPTDTSPKGLTATIEPGSMSFYFYPAGPVMPTVFLCAIDGGAQVQIPAETLAGGSVRLNYPIPTGLTPGDHVLTVTARSTAGDVALAPQHILRVDSTTGAWSYYYTYVSCNNSTGICK